MVAVLCTPVALLFLSTLSGSFANVSNLEFGEPDYTLLNRNATRCSSTNLSFEKESLLHTWDLNGILKYLTYLRRFDQSFEVKTEDVNFKSENVDGKWVFRFTKLNPTILATKTLQETVDDEDSTNLQEPSPMKISAAYSYEATTQRQMNFGIYLTVIHDNRELVLPLQTSSEPTISQQRTYVTARANAPPIYTFTHSFLWPDVHEEFNNMVTARIGEGKDDLSLRFLIMAYYPNDPQFSNNENCNEELLSEISSKSFGNVRPPFIKHTNSMLNDDKYTDMYLRVGNEDFPAHRIILATTSPVFSALIYNETLLNMSGNLINESGSDPSGPFPMPTVIHIDDDISAETVEEMLRYIYTGKVENLLDLAGQLIVAAERYGLPELKRICERVMMGQVKLQNSIEMYILGMQVNSNKLTKKAFTIMRANKAKIVSQFDEFRKLSIKYPSLMFELFVS